MAFNSTAGDSAAESYVSVAQATTFHAARGNTAWAEATESAQEIALRRGTAYLDGRYRNQWKGARTTVEQALAWPRTDVLDEDGVEIDDNVVPRVVQDACCEAALRELSNPGSLTPDLARGGEIKSETVGPLSVTYADGATPRTVITVLDDLLSGVTSSTSANVGVGFFDRA